MKGTPLELAKQNHQRIFDLVGVKRFVGREWLIELYNDFRRRHDQGYFLVEADAGLGKTSFAAWLVERYHYIGHFTRLDGGQERDKALLNLGARLITELELFPDIETRFVLPGLDRGMVPEWVGEPEHFPRLLELAAQKATQLKRTITLVVDGLDEEQPPSTPVPLGLPEILPSGVWIIATCRTGTPVLVRDTGFEVARIDADDPRNLADMRDYLSAATAWPGLARRLDAHGMSTESFIGRMIDQCGGVWVYLAYLLTDLINGELALADLDHLPAQLSLYFAANLERRRADQLWATEDLPLLGALAAVFEPVEAAMLSDVTGIGRHTVGLLCGQRYRAFLRVERANRRKRFAVYHRSLSEFLAGHVEDGPAMPEATRHLTDMLSEHVETAHECIADYYLAQFDHPTNLRAMADKHGGYGMRHLVTHLRQVGRHRDIRRLLSTTDGRQENRLRTWHAEHGTIDAYTQNVTLAIGPARQQTDREPVLHAGLESLRFEVFATLFLAGQAAEVDNGFVDLIGPLLTFGVWDVATARDRVGTIGNPTLRAASLLAIMPHIPAAERESCLRQARTIAEEIRTTVDLIAVRTEFHRHVPADPDALLAQIRDLKDPAEAAHALIALLTYHPERPRLYEEAVDLVRSDQNPISRAYGLVEAVSVAPRVDVDSLVRETLTLAATLSEDPDPYGLDVQTIDHRSTIAAALLDTVPSRPLWEEVHAAEVPDGYLGVQRLVILARHGPTPARTRSLARRALLLARDIPDSHIAARAMVMVFDVLSDHD